MARQTTSVTVPTQVFQAGAFPAICARTGLPTREVEELEATYVSPWALLGLVFGVIALPFFILITRKTVGGAIPMEPWPQRGQRRLIGRALLVGTLILFLISLTLDGDAQLSGMLLSLFLAIVGGVFMVAGSDPVQVRLTSDLQLVTLSKVHCDFARAVRESMEASLQNSGWPNAPQATQSWQNPAPLSPVWLNNTPSATPVQDPAVAWQSWQNPAGWQEPAVAGQSWQNPAQQAPPAPPSAARW